MKLNNKISYVYASIISCVFVACASGKEDHHNYEAAENNYLMNVADILAGYSKDMFHLVLARNMFDNMWSNMLNDVVNRYQDLNVMATLVKSNASTSELQFCRENLLEFTKKVTDMLDCRGRLYMIDPILKILKLE